MCTQYTTQYTVHTTLRSNLSMYLTHRYTANQLRQAGQSSLTTEALTNPPGFKISTIAFGFDHFPLIHSTYVVSAKNARRALLILIPSVSWHNPRLDFFFFFSILHWTRLAITLAINLFHRLLPCMMCSIINVLLCKVLCIKC